VAYSTTRPISRGATKDIIKNTRHRDNLKIQDKIQKYKINLYKE